MFPTPNCVDAKGGTRKGKGQTQLCHVVKADGQPDQANPNTNGRPSGSLNSAWVATLMGYPSDWLDLPTKVLSELMATRSPRK